MLGQASDPQLTSSDLEKIIETSVFSSKNKNGVVNILYYFVFKVFINKHALLTSFKK